MYMIDYEPRMHAKRNTVSGIVERLNEEADDARRYLDACELEVLEPRYSDNFVLKLLYEHDAPPAYTGRASWIREG